MTDLQQMTGAQVLVRALEYYSVETVFGVAGESYLAVLDAFYDSDIRFITNRQEGCACFMAEAYAKLTGKTGVCFVTRGPGATNGAIGVHTAKQDSTPLVYFIGQVARDQEGREAFQEIDYRDMFKPPISKAVFHLEHADDVGRVVAEAFTISQTGRKGPVVVSLPEDMLCDMTQNVDIQPASTAVKRDLEQDQMDQMKDVLSKAQKPVAILGGSGWTPDIIAKFEAYAQAHSLPVVASFRRQDLFNNEHPCYVGELGTGPNPQLVSAIKDEADVVLAINTRLSEITSQGYTLFDIPDPRQKLIHVYPDQAELGKVYTPHAALHMTPTDFAAQLDLLSRTYDFGDWCNTLRSTYENWTRFHNSEGGFDVDMDLIFKHIREHVPEDTVFTTDAGNFSGWAQRYLKYGDGNRLLAPTSGAMGYGAPAAISASLTAPDQTVIGLMGDGGFMMCGQSLATAMMYQARPILIVFNNSIYGTIRMHQERDYPGRVVATHLHNPDFVKLAESYGAQAFKVTKTQDFYPAFEQALKSETLCLIEVQNLPEQITTTRKMSEL